MALIKHRKLTRVEFESLDPVVRQDANTEWTIIEADGSITRRIGEAPIGIQESCTNINYADLVTLRNNSQLVPGTWYRIIDYETTTVQPETQSAGHLFDIIVQALDEKTLSENASAIQSARDVNGYFDGVNLGAWKLKYRLDNDNEHYYWTDTFNGKGVIYRMIDEYDNDLPYDFKNIQYKRYIIDEYSKNTEFEDRYYASKDMNDSVVPREAVIDDGDFIWAYMFTVIDENGVVNDVSLNKNKTFVDGGDEVYYYTKNNKIGSYTYTYYDEIEGIEKRTEALGNNVMLYDYDYDGYWNFYGFYDNTITNNFYSNTIGNAFCSNTIGDSFNSNTIGYYFDYNTTRNRFSNNTIGNGFNSNMIGTGFNSNTIGDSFEYNTMGDSFTNNTIGDSFKYSTIGHSFYYNMIGNRFEYNTIGNYVRYIQFSVDGDWSNIIRYLNIRSGLQGASSANKLDLYYSGLYHRLYPTTIERIANGKIVSIHQETPLVWGGKKKEANTSSIWSSVTEPNGNYVRFLSGSSRTITPKYTNSGVTLQYSVDSGTTWNTIASGSATTSATEHWFRGQATETKSLFTSYTSSNAWVFSGSSDLEVYGNLNFLLCDTLGDEVAPTALGSYSYASMFRDCTSLTIAPELPATTVEFYSYAHMFQGCTSLTTATELPTTTLENNCYYYMFYGCTAFKVSTTNTGSYIYPWRIPTSGSGSGSTKIGWNSSMLSGTGGTFKSNPTINTTYYVQNKPI